MEEEFLKSFRRELGTILGLAMRKHGNRTIKDVFFNEWFRKRGKAYFFLFRKNLACTNIQFAELLSLVRSHLRLTKTKALFPDVQVITFATAFESVEKLLTIVPWTPEGIQELVTLYAGPISRVLVAEPFWGSCTIFVPPHLELDVAAVCGESGYIHSCGRNVFSRPFGQTSEKHLEEAIAEYFCHAPLQNGNRLLFRPYAHEDFSPHDREVASDLKDGLDEVKLHLEKYFLGDKRLVSALENLQRAFCDKLYFPPPGDYRKTDVQAQTDLDKGRTLWLITDRGVDPITAARSTERFLICYAQEWFNASGFQVFDENKPAWIAHTTLPHSLASAMINITRPWRKHDERPNRGLDPFVGSGTIWLEAIKFRDLSFSGSDKQPITQLLVSDNLQFFMMSASELDQLRLDLEQLSNVENYGLPEPDGAEELTGAMRDYAWAASLFKGLRSEHREVAPEIGTDVVRRLKEVTFQTRIFFYLILRARLRHVGGHLRHSTTWTRAYLHELEILCRQIARLRDERRLLESPEMTQKHHSKSLAVYFGPYSLHSQISIGRLTEIVNCRTIEKTISEGNAVSLGRTEWDLIITDPPYGFNTDENGAKLAALYAQMLTTFVEHLADDGQLVLCLPEASHSGRPLNAFTHRGFVTHQILAAAEAAGKEVVRTAFVNPNPTTLFAPPYYWESERALRRSIVQFRFRTRIPNNEKAGVNASGFKRSR